MLFRLVRFAINQNRAFDLAVEKKYPDAFQVICKCYELMKPKYIESPRLWEIDLLMGEVAMEIGEIQISDEKIMRAKSKIERTINLNEDEKRYLFEYIKILKRKTGSISRAMYDKILISNVRDRILRRFPIRITE